MTTKFSIGYNPDASGDTVAIAKMSVTYNQSADTCSSSNEDQFLTVSIENADMGEDQLYYNISTKGCDHWSIDSPEQFLEILHDFKRRLYSHKSKKEEK